MYDNGTIGQHDAGEESSNKLYKFHSGKLDIYHGQG